MSAPLFEWDGQRLLPGAAGLTEHQARALDLARHVVVTAGAGSGKTFTLSRRCVRILASFAWDAAQGRAAPGPEALLVSTFTEKAAAEMRGRIRAALQGAVRDLVTHRQRYVELAGLASVDGLHRHLRSSLHHFDRARISTFHGFCAATLREFAAPLGLDPGFTIAQGTSARALLDAAVGDALGAAEASGAPEVSALLDSMSLPRLHEALATWVDQRAGWGPLRSLLARPDDDVLQTWANTWGAVELTAVEARLDDGAVRAALLALANLDGDDAPAAITGARDALDALGTPAETLVARVIRAKRAIGALCKGDGRFATTHHSWVGSKKALGAERHGAIRDAWLELTGQLADLLPGIEPLQTLPGEADQASLPILRGLVAVGDDATARYAEAKRAARSLDFADLLLEVRRLQTEHPEPARRLRERLRHILVDEFQDTNAVQWAIVRDLLGDPLPSAGLFLVGDPKQAIYRFRGGDVTIFDRATAELAECGCATVDFPDNFRSRPDTIAQINSLFAWLLAPDGPERPPWEAPFGELEARRDGDRDGGRLLLLPSPTPGDDDPLSGLLPRAREAEAVAALLAEQLPGLPAHDGLKAAILVRRRTHLPTYARALRLAGVPHVVARGRGFFGRAEVVDVGNLLLALAHDDDATALLGALRGPFLGLEDAWLLALARLGGGPSPRALQDGWERLVLQAPDDAALDRWAVRAARTVRAFDELPAEARAAIGGAAARFRRWRALSRRLPLSSLLATIAREAALPHWLALEDASGQARANIDKLRSMAVAYDADGAEGLAGFALHLRAQSDAEADEGEADLDATAPVVLMTVHQSKGLEFPLVVLPDLAVQLARADSGPLATGQLDRQQVPGIQVPLVRDGERELHPTLLRTLLTRRGRDEEIAEARRLLYVAFTRARDRLALFLPEPPPKGPRGRDGSTTWAEWIHSWLREAPEPPGIERLDAIGAAPAPPEGAPPDALPEDQRRRLQATIHAPTITLLAPHELVGEHPSEPADARWAPPSDHPGLGRARGVVVHGCLEDGLLHPSPATDSRVDGALAELGLIDDAHRAWMRAELEAHLAGFRTTAPPALLGGDALREVSFRLPLPDGRWLRGAIDVLYRDEARRRWVVLDYKSNRGDPAPLVEHYRPQLLAYGWAAARILPDLRDAGWRIDGHLLFTAGAGVRVAFEGLDEPALRAALKAQLPPA